MHEVYRFMRGFLLRAFATAAASDASAAGEPTLIQTDAGKVRGTVAEGVIAFKGIPFAQPPVGALRWRPPQPVKPWEGIRDAMAFSPNPMQPAPSAGSALSVLAPAGFSEDCLYLNVWRPATTESDPLPVMVWIYAGGLVRRGASMYPGEALARQGIAFVSFNYRLNRLGFFAHPALAREAPDDLRANYGYMDQLAALQWVQRNIAAFGGDPTNVTIAGESAGGGSVLVLLTSPMARGLFRRAILQSPNIPGARAGAGPMRALASAESIAVQYARSLGIEGDDQAVLARLRAVPAETLAEGIEAYVQAIFGGPQIPGLAHSIIDGRLVVEAPEAALRAGRQTLAPVVVGANDHDLAASPAQTKDALFAPFGPLASQARKLYDPNGNVSFKDLTQAIVADETMVEPSRHLAERMTKAGQPAYFYRFSYVPEAWREKTRGASHGAEVPFAFDRVSALMNDKASEADLAMARTMSGYWVDFVKAGDPNGGGRPAWPRYDPARGDVLKLTNAGVAFGPDPLKARLDLWRAVWEQGRSAAAANFIDVPQ
jgi:para-nitrobenzyl esterase